MALNTDAYSISVHRPTTLSDGDVVYPDHGVDEKFSDAILECKGRMSGEDRVDKVELAVKIIIEHHESGDVTADLLLRYFLPDRATQRYSCSMQCWYKDGERKVKRFYEMDSAYTMGTEIPSLIFGNMASDRAVVGIDAVNEPNVVAFINLPCSLRECFGRDCESTKFKVKDWAFTYPQNNFGKKKQNKRRQKK